MFLRIPRDSPSLPPRSVVAFVPPVRVGKTEASFHPFAQDEKDFEKDKKDPDRLGYLHRENQQADWRERTEKMVSKQGNSAEKLRVKREAHRLNRKLTKSAMAVDENPAAGSAANTPLSSLFPVPLSDVFVFVLYFRRGQDGRGCRHGGGRGEEKEQDEEDSKERTRPQGTEGKGWQVRREQEEIWQIKVFSAPSSTSSPFILSVQIHDSK